MRRAEAEVGKAEAELAQREAEVRESVGRGRAGARRTQTRELTVDRARPRGAGAARAAGGLALVQEHPWEGRKLQTGDAIYPGLPVILIPDLDSLDVVAMLFDVDDGEIDAGRRRASASRTPARSSPFACRVRDVAAVARELPGLSTRRVFRVLLDFEDRELARARLRPGMSMRVEVVAERRERARLVPRVRARGSKAIRRACACRTATLEPVRLGPCNASDCVLEAEAAP